jgi:hypothetical protein
MEMSALRSANKLAAAVVGIALAWCGAVMGADTVQINVKSLLNARAVTTFSNGKLYTWSKGIDGNGGGDGYITHASAVFLNRTDVLTLPDSAGFPANGNHPTMILNYSNTDSTGFQTHYLGASSGNYSGIDSITFSVPQGNYSKMYIALTSSEGSTALTVVATYTDGPVTSNVTCPDYAQALTANFFFVDSNLAKWSPTNTVNENAGHNINGLNLTTDPAKILTSVKLIKKTAGSYLVFWGATGIGTGITAAVQPLGRMAPLRELSAVHCVSGRNAGIQFVNLPAATQLTVYSAAGESVAHAVSANGGSVAFDRGVANSGAVSSGVYFCELRCGNAKRTMRLIDAK